MNTIRSTFLKDYILKLAGEYASASKIHTILNISLSYTYIIAKNNKIRSRTKYGRTEYNMEDFVRALELGQNNNIISPAFTKEDFDINNYHNWEAQNHIEKFLQNYLLDELGEFTTIRDLVELFKVSKTIWYEALEEGKIIYFKISTRKIILTRALLPFLREAMATEI